jgi:hypothetical protein
VMKSKDGKFPCSTGRLRWRHPLHPLFTVRN